MSMTLPKPFQGLPLLLHKKGNSRNNGNKADPHIRPTRTIIPLSVSKTTTPHQTRINSNNPPAHPKDRNKSPGLVLVNHHRVLYRASSSNRLHSSIKTPVQVLQVIKTVGHPDTITKTNKGGQTGSIIMKAALRYAPCSWRYHKELWSWRKVGEGRKECWGKGMWSEGIWENIFKSEEKEKKRNLCCVDVVRFNSYLGFGYCILQGSGVAIPRMVGWIASFLVLAVRIGGVGFSTDVEIRMCTFSEQQRDQAS